MTRVRASRTRCGIIQPQASNIGAVLYRDSTPCITHQKLVGAVLYRDSNKSLPARFVTALITERGFCDANESVDSKVVSGKVTIRDRGVKPLLH